MTQDCRKELKMNLSKPEVAYKEIKGDARTLLDGMIDYVLDNHSGVQDMIEVLGRNRTRNALILLLDNGLAKFLEDDDGNIYFDIVQ